MIATWRNYRLLRLGVLAALGLAALASQPAHASIAQADEGPFTVSITGDEHVWYVRYPGEDGVLGSPDDRMGMRDLHLPAGRSIRLFVHSEDYIYRVFSKGIELSKMAIPRKEVVADLSPVRVGSYDLEGEPMCGLKLGEMVGQVIVHSPADFSAWSDSARPFEASFGKEEIER